MIFAQKQLNFFKQNTMEGLKREFKIEDEEEEKDDIVIID